MRLSISPQQYLVLTVHRHSNTDNLERVENIIGALIKGGLPVVFSVHPSTRKSLKGYGIWDRPPVNFIVTEPLGILT